jgi:hypothetical protein
MRTNLFRAATAAFLLLAAGGTGAIAAGAAQDISGTWWATKYDAKLNIVGGGALPLTAAGKEAYQKNRAGLRDGSIVDAARKFCVPDGIPRVLANPYPFEIIQAPPGQITMVYELNHQIRTVAMDKKLPSYEELIPYPFYNGHSVGRWEGDTLVVDVGNFNDTVNYRGAGKNLHLVERFTRVGQNDLRYEVTVDDATTFAKPWTAALNMKTQPEQMFEYACHEGNHAMSNMLSAARAAEKAAASTSTK